MAEGGGALSVSAALAIAKRQLEEITVKVVGEVSELSSNPRYKAVYFSVKDEKSSMSCMMWKNRYDSLGFQLQVGALVELTGRFSIYAAKGRMNFDVFSIQLAGEGRLRMQVANLANKLRAEGLMEQSRKLPVPTFPDRIGLVTSPRGAAVYDVLRTLRRRFPSAEVVFAGVAVEGAGAPSGISEGLQAVHDAGAEVILLVRGGGSFEDLMPFNDEGLARHIASIGVPVVTGIGHEPDNSIADMVADFRASTPTAAAEAVSPDAGRLAESLRSLERRLGSMMLSRLASAAHRLEIIGGSSALSEPSRLLEPAIHRLDNAERRLHGAIPGYFESSSRRLDDAARRMEVGLASLRSPYTARISQRKGRMSSLGEMLLAPFRQRLSNNVASIEALSPLAVLARGYSIARDEDGSILKSVSGIDVGNAMTVQLNDGIVDCTINDIVQEVIALEDIDG